MNESILLSVLIFSPLLGILILTFMNKNENATLKLVGFLATLPAVLISVYLFVQVQLGISLSTFAEKAKWISFGAFSGGDNRPFTVNYELAIDEFSLIMLLLTSILAALSAAASIHIKQNVKGYFLLFLVLQIGMLGVFAAQNLILFFIFFEITLIPMFFLIGKWGYVERERAAYHFLMYNGFGSAILLIVIMILFTKTGTTNIQLLQEMMGGTNVPMVGAMSEDLRLGLLIALLIAFGVKLPIFPLHRWMLKVHVQAPPPIVMLHSGILLKIGAYGLIRFGIGIFPEEFSRLGYLLMIFGVINLLYGAFLALIQEEFKMVLAYSSISHMGIVLIGLGAMNEAGVQGAIFQVVSHGLISALLFFLVGVLTERLQTTRINQLGGVAKLMPLTAGSLLVGAMASLGLPGMSGFISEVTAFLGAFEVAPELAALGTIGIILTAAYLLRAVLSITFGQVKKEHRPLKDLTWYEGGPVLIMIFLIVAIGVYPNVLAIPLQATVEAITKGIGG
ncbi:NADH-quinone oxidoreductase subunit M [Metabacillus herbersteinensis]|uniref:NADH-quinone oxidoreductase subunit M n=1 Tax=Metabacillus herbersteinensis TaxID=283816 RepID=A0ABV6GGA1_9BACI